MTPGLEDFSDSNQHKEPEPELLQLANANATWNKLKCKTSFCLWSKPDEDRLLLQQTYLSIK